ncbi:hypothetical protein [Paenibacillus sp. FSL K6-2524]|uniref:hypothetical protein n=1 Tax=Paenibacillus sp. FSL K6-2524 TaxID=2954516 RepID=UPI0030FCB2F8
MKKVGIIGLVLSLSLCLVPMVSAETASKEVSHPFALTQELDVVETETPFNGEAISKGNENYFGVTDLSTQRNTQTNKLSIETKLEFYDNNSESINENEVRVDGQVILHNGNDYQLDVDGVISKYCMNGKTYYFGPLLTKLNHNGKEVAGTVGIFYNKTDEKYNVSIWMGEIGNEDGSSLLNFGDSTPEQTEVIQSFQRYLDEVNQKNTAILSESEANEFSSSESSIDPMSSGDYFRHALSVGTSKSTGVGNDGNASNWIAMQHIYINDALSRDEFTTTVLWRDKLFTNNESLLKYLKNSGVTTYLSLNNYAVNVHFYAGGNQSRITDSTPTDSNLALKGMYKPVKATAGGLYTVAYNIFAEFWNARLDRVYWDRTDITFVNTMSADENKAIDHKPGNLVDFPAYNAEDDEYGISHEILTYLPESTTQNNLNGEFIASTNLVWFISDANGWTGYPLANLLGITIFETNP